MHDDTNQTTQTTQTTQTIRIKTATLDGKHIAYINQTKPVLARAFS